MPEIGQIISHYRVIEKLGQGGMGEVFLAHDTSLDRKVALKFLPDIFSGDPERLARFEREAKLLASLNHPNIATIYGLEQAEGKRFLAMELVEGETLAQQIERGPLPVDDALEVCLQIAEGLEAAHEKGVIHRDLKPANVKITPEGKVKILDFGLAKAFQGDSPAADASKSPTLTDQMTRPGVILGTAAYMAPEQAKGRAVDKRADIWAFGCILYECLTGKRPFEGETITETLAAILKVEPDWKAMPVAVPWRVKDLVHRCLEKNAQERLHDIADARIEIMHGVLAVPGVEESIALAPVRWRILPWLVAVVMTLTAAAFALRGLLPPAKTSLQRRYFVVPLPEPDNSPSNFLKLAISRDGTQLAYASGSPSGLLYHKRLNEWDFKPVPGTEGARDPFFSPNGEWLGFSAGGRLIKVPVAGGPQIPLTETIGPNILGERWETDDFILFQPDYDRGIAYVPASGGTWEFILRPDPKKNERGLLCPQRLPLEDLLLFTAFTGDIASFNEGRIAVGRPGNSPERWDLTGGTYGRYLPTGHLVYAYDGKLMAAPLDLARRSLARQAVEVLDGIKMYPMSAVAEFAISDIGDLLYIQGGMVKGRDSFVLFDLNGNKEIISPPRSENESHIMQSLRFSPDGLQIAVAMAKANDDIHIYDRVNKTLTRCTFEKGDEQVPVWVPPEGKRLVYASLSGQNARMYIKDLDRSGSPEPIFHDNNPRYPSSITPDGKVLAFVENNPKTRWDIWTGPIGNAGQAKPFLNSEHSEGFPAFSPDGQWIAYQSDKSGQRQVYLARFPDGSNEKPVSQDGGTEPRWARDLLS